MYSKNEYKLVWKGQDGSEHVEYFPFADLCDWRLKQVKYVEYHIYETITYCLNRF